MLQAMRDGVPYVAPRTGVRSLVDVPRSFPGMGQPRPLPRATATQLIADRRSRQIAEGKDSQLDEFGMIR